MKQPLHYFKRPVDVRVLSCLFLLVWSVPVWSQNGDCNTAVSVCEDVYSIPNSPAGTGNVVEIAPGTCNTSGEFNSSWYVFTAQETGTFGFILNPNNLNDDYDWSLYDITDNGCAGINSGASPEVSCNSFGLFGGVQGPTGISSAEGGTGNSNGPGDINGPPFNQDLNVTAGDVYALVVMNFSATLNGYALDFTESNVGIFDNQPPTVTDVTTNCSQNQFTVSLSESCQTSGMVAGNMSVSFEGQDFPVASVSGVSGNADHDFVINVNGLGGASGDVTLTFTNALVDLCGNPLDLTYTFPLAGTIDAGIVTTASCDGQDGSLIITASGLNGECYTFTLNGAPLAGGGCDSAEATGLSPGTYNIVVNGTVTSCPVSFTAEVTDIPLEVDAGEDIVLCDMNTPLDATFSGGVFNWVPQNNLSFNQDSNPSTVVIADVPGTYTIIAQVSQGNCTIADGVDVTFSIPPALTVEALPANCFGECNGAIELVNASGPVSATIGDGFLDGQEIAFTNLCSGEYVLNVIFGPECAADYDLFVDSPPQVIAAFDANPWVTTVNMTEVELINLSENADSVSWFLFHDPLAVNTEDQWTVDLPELPGVYSIQLTATGENGCTDVFLGNILVEDDFQIFVPSAVTPDFDGINDVFLPRFSYTPERYELVVFNRWGDVIFRTDDPFQAWMLNSRNGEHFIADGVYNWLITAKGKEIEERELSGHVVVIR